MDLTLYKMAATGRINLTGLVSNRETYYSGERDSETGVVTLTPVRIVSPGDKATAEVTAPAETDDQADDQPPTY